MDRCDEVVERIIVERITLDRGTQVTKKLEEVSHSESSRGFRSGDCGDEGQEGDECIEERGEGG